MVRLGSGISAYTEPTWSYFWKQKDVRDYCETQLSKVGDIARQHDVPCKYAIRTIRVLASDKEEVVNRSIEEFEYHVDVLLVDGIR